MSPDIDTMTPSTPPSRPPRPRRISIDTTHPIPTSPSPRSPSLSSLQAAATLNASLHHRSPPATLARRRSSLAANLALNDPTLPSPGELQPSSYPPHHHQRQPSLGALHQDLEAETEGQVNRLLHMIRLQQEQLAALKLQAAHSQRQPSAERPPLSRHSSSALTTSSTATNSPAQQRPASPPALGAEEFVLLPSGSSPGVVARDDPAFYYQAETQTLTRENQMLRCRVRELGTYSFRCISPLFLPSIL